MAKNGQYAQNLMTAVGAKIGADIRWWSVAVLGPSRPIVLTLCRYSGGRVVPGHHF